MKTDNRTLLFQISLWILVFVCELKKVYFFSQNDIIMKSFNYIELVVYLSLIVCILINRWKLKELIIIIIIECIFGIGMLTTGNAVFFRGFLIIVSAKGVQLKKLLRTCRSSIFVVVVISFLLFILGLSNRSDYVKEGVSLGFSHPNQASQVIMILTLIWITEKSFKLKLKQIVALYLINIIVFLITGSKSVFLILLLTPILILLYRRSMSKDGIIYKTALLVQPLMLVFTIVSGLNYENNRIILFLDTKYFELLNTFTGRIYLNWRAFNTYGFSLFGKAVDLAENLTVDNAYAVALITMGIIPTLLFTAGYCFVVYKAIKERNYIILTIAVVLSIYGIMEAAMIEVYNNFVYLSMFTIPFSSKINISHMLPTMMRN